MMDLISRQPDVPDINVGDMISRANAIDAINDLPNCENGYSDVYDKACIIGLIEALPSAQPEVDCQKCVFCGFAGFKQFQTALPEPYKERREE